MGFENSFRLIRISTQGTWRRKCSSEKKKKKRKSGHQERKQE
jgi:hypothetical protein